MMFFSEHRRLRFGVEEHTTYGSTITWHELDFSTFPPRRKCTDSDPLRTLQASRTLREPGCLCSMLGGGGSLGLFLGLLTVMSQFRINPRIAAYGTVISSTIFVVSKYALFCVGGQIRLQVWGGVA